MKTVFSPARLTAALLALAMLAATGASTWAQQEGRFRTHRQFGEVVNVTHNQVTIRTPEGQTKTFDVPQDARILRDGQKSDLADLKPGDDVLLAFDKDQPNQALLLRAFSQERLPGRAEREARRTGTEQRRAALGVVIQAVPDQKGVRILRVRPDSPAAQVGLQSGDILLSINDQNIDSPSKLNDLVQKHQPGDKLKITFKRADHEQTVEATLAGRQAFGPSEGTRAPRREAGRQPVPEEEEQGIMEDQGDMGDTGPSRAWLGLFLSETDHEKGVEVLRVFPGSPADKAGIQSGDVVLSFDGEKVTTVSDVTDTLQQMEPGETIKIVVLRDNQEHEFQAKLGDHSRFLRDQRRFREGMRFGPRGERFRAAPPWSAEEEPMMEAQQRQRLERMGQEVLQELRALREDVQQLQKEIAKPSARK